MACKHKPSRIYAWRAYDGTMCVACCDCGEVLTGAASRPTNTQEGLSGAILRDIDRLWGSVAHPEAWH